MDGVWIYGSADLEAADEPPERVRPDVFRDLLGLEVVVGAPRAELAADARALHAAPGGLHEGGLRAVHPDDAAAEPLGHAGAARAVAGEHGAAEAVRGVVGQAQRLLLRVEGAHR